MLVYRIGKKKYAYELHGEGARLFGGRWNEIGVPCIYTSESRALALLEYTVNVQVEEMPARLSITTIEIPNTGILKVKLAELPKYWNLSPAQASSKVFGTTLLMANMKLVIKIPSAVIPNEFNYIINPLHKDISLIKIVSVQEFAFDKRIKSK